MATQEIYTSNRNDESNEVMELALPRKSTGIRHILQLPSCLLFITLSYLLTALIVKTQCKGSLGNDQDESHILDTLYRKHCWFPLVHPSFTLFTTFGYKYRRNQQEYNARKVSEDIAIGASRDYLPHLHLNLVFQSCLLLNSLLLEATRLRQVAFFLSINRGVDGTFLKALTQVQIFLRISTLCAVVGIVSHWLLGIQGSIKVVATFWAVRVAFWADFAI